LYSSRNITVTVPWRYRWARSVAGIGHIKYILAENHLERMEENRMPKKIFTQELEGTRRRGRPRKRWKEEVERDLQVLGVRRWSWLQIGKNGWTLVDRPKPTVGCSANGRRRKRRRRIMAEKYTSAA
jgi:hypothetical protein